MRMTAGQIAALLGLERPTGADALVESVAIDSREAGPGSLFACFKGVKVDGHDYALAAQERGAAAILASRPLEGTLVPVLVVENVEKALGRLAAFWRGRFRGKVLCVTGTAGKTTLKEMLRSILSRAGRTACSEKNHNNQIGMPISILAASGDEDFWLLEAGISHEGDMEELAEMARPDLALILNVGPGHSEGLGRKGVAWCKTRLLERLAPGGLALVSADYPDLVAEARKSGADILFFSANPDSDAPFRPLAGADEPAFLDLDLAGNACRAAAPFYGAWLRESATAAAAAARLLGISPEIIAEGIAAARQPAGRFNRVEAGSWTIFDDTYNANPLSMARMLDSAAAWAGKRKLPLVLALGEMGELGEAAGEWHRKLGGRIARLKPAALFWKGGFLSDLARGLVEAGSTVAPVPVDGPESFLEAWGRRPDLQGGVILFKGSRVNRLEKLCEAFEKQAG